MKKLLKAILFFFLFWLFYKAYFYFFSNPKKELVYENQSKRIVLENNGLSFPLITEEDSVNEFLEENDIQIGERDDIVPPKKTKIYPGMNIVIRRAVKIKVAVDNQKREVYTLEKTIRKALEENNIPLGRLDKTVPDLESLPQDNLIVTITRIDVEEVIKEEPIEFKVIAKKDDKLGWREKKVETPGEKGVKEVKYKITYKNGKEVSRTVLESKVAKEPVSQVEVQGTYVKLGKSHTGQGTWYSFKGGLFAASPWLPMGSYAKVTNKANGKSVIVQINDRGPFGPGRIIDLDKVAFAKIASIGAGVIGVKVEEVLN